MPLESNVVSENGLDETLDLILLMFDTDGAALPRKVGSHDAEVSENCRMFVVDVINK